MNVIRKMCNMGLFIIFAITVFSVSCSKICGNNDNINRPETPREDGIFFIDEATAEYYVGLHYQDKEVISVVPYLHDSDTLFYAFEFTHGWVIVSADSRTAPVLAESSIGHIASNRQFQIWLSVAVDSFASLRQDASFHGNEDVIRMWGSYRDLAAMKRNNIRMKGGGEEGEGFWIHRLISNFHTTSVVESRSHLLSTRWGQAEPWNCSIPSAKLTGCIATAVAQVLYYFHYTTGIPAGLYHSVLMDNYDRIEISDYTNPSFRWDEMRTVANGLGSASYVSDLMVTIGKKVGTQYGYDASWSSLDVAVLLSCGIIANQGSYSIDNIISDLRRDKPVLIGATPQNSNGGHCWVIDGFNRFRIEAVTVSEFDYVYSTDGYTDIMGIYTQEEVDSMHPGVVSGKQYTDTSVRYDVDLLMNWGYDDADDSDPFVGYGGWDTILRNRMLFYNISTVEMVQ